MNLSAYDRIKSNPTKSKIYINNSYSYIITREVKHRKYYCFVKRYEPSTDENVLFLVLLDDKPDDRTVSKVRIDNYGRYKFNLSVIRDYLDVSKNKIIDIKLTLETEADDGDIYKLEIESD